MLIKPVGYQAGKKYPLLVAIHGGPAAADLLSFNGGYGAQTYAGKGWVVLMPNYRGSTNYGEAHKVGIVGNYFPPGYNDIMTGVDALIGQGLVDSTKMGVLGWSAGGHWSNWIVTHTNRFKAISKVVPARRTGFRCTRRVTCSAIGSIIWVTSCRMTISRRTGGSPRSATSVRPRPHDDSRGGRGSASTESAECGAPYGAQAGRRAHGVVHVSRRLARHSRCAEPATQEHRGDGMDGLLGLGLGQEVLLARCAPDARRSEGRQEGRDQGALSRALRWCSNPRARAASRVPGRTSFNGRWRWWFGAVSMMWSVASVEAQASGAVTAPADSARLTVTVRNEADGRVPNAEVIVVLQDREVRKRTDATGVVRFALVPDTLELLVRGIGYTEQTHALAIDLARVAPR